jgi:hypothetical protein
MYKEAFELASVAKDVLSDEELLAKAFALTFSRKSLTDEQFVQSLYFLVANTAKKTMIATLECILTDEQVADLEATAGELLNIFNGDN